MNADFKRLKYLSEKFGITSLQMDDTESTRNARNIERQEYIDDEQRRNERDMLRKGQQIRRGVNRYDVFNYIDTASIRGQEKVMFVECVLFNGR